ncbi:MAG: AAA family ATPase [Planctomycetota bacterium]
MSDPHNLQLGNQSEVAFSRAPAQNEILKQLTHPKAWDSEATRVDTIETHISHVFLVGDRAYKVKKAIQTDYLDYSTLEKRKRFCEEQVRLDSRFAPGLYLGVVRICQNPFGQVSIATHGPVVEYAVEMRRFETRDSLAQRVDDGFVTNEHIRRIAQTIGRFHLAATVCDPEESQAAIDRVPDSMKKVIDGIDVRAGSERAATVSTIRVWAETYFRRHEDDFRMRAKQRSIRECHGDLHLNNIVHWRGKDVPFDGIEFSDDLRKIDVLSDAAFLAMDLAAHGHCDGSRSFISEYLDTTGDHDSIATLRWYMVYRALVRAMVCSTSAAQHRSFQRSGDHQQACDRYIQLAYRFSPKDRPAVHITYGPSGSGKTTISELVVQRYGAIRLRSDIERKRECGVPTHRPATDAEKLRLYTPETNDSTYARLKTLTQKIVRAGYPVVVDATFLRRSDRKQFEDLAAAEGAHFAILDCRVRPDTLRRRIQHRQRSGRDISDADLSVLNEQLKSGDPLTDAERRFVVDIPEAAREPANGFLRLGDSSD